MTHARAEVWGNVRTQALIWAPINPRLTPRAGQCRPDRNAVRTPAASREATADPLIRQPQEVQLAFNLVGAHCQMGAVSSGVLAAAKSAMSATPNTGALFAHWFDRILPVAMAGSCHGLGPNELLALIEAGLDNPKLQSASRGRI